MTYVVTDACVKCKYTDCIEVCPVDCFHEGELMVVIDPKTCIDCGVCVAECPVDAISPESEDLLIWIERGAYFSGIWPKITTQKNPLKDAEKFHEEQDKFKKYIENS